jgi:hypothetical protein
LGLSIPPFIKSRRAKYYGVRKDALQRALRWVLIMGGIQGIAILLLIICPILQRGNPQANPDAQATQTSSAITATALSTATSSATDSPPTSTPSPTPIPTEITTKEPAVYIEFKALSTEINHGQPLDPGDSFPPGDHRIYVFFRYQDMQDGLETTIEWYKEEELIEFCSDTWLWGQDEDYGFGGANGASLIFCKAPGGWEPGNHAIHVLVEEQLQFIVEFQITKE